MPEDRPEMVTGLSGCQDMTGYLVELDAGEQVARCHLDVGRKHLNRHGILHGGVTSMLLDVACGHAAAAWFDAEDPPLVLTLSLTVNFVSAASEGRVTATGRPTGGGKSMAYANGELRDAKGCLIATATAVFKRGKHRPSSD